MQDADHIDVKTVVGDISLRQFVAGVFSYEPGWMRFLYRIRGVFMHLLGMKQDGTPTAPRLSAEQISMSPGDRVGFLTVVEASDGHYWIAGDDEDKHLAFYVIATTEPLEGTTKRLALMTIVRYKNWAGPVYFNVIRPFHHVVVRAAIRAAAKRPAAPLPSSGDAQ